MGMRELMRSTQPTTLTEAFLETLPLAATSRRALHAVANAAWRMTCWPRAAGPPPAAAGPPRPLPPLPAGVLDSATVEDLRAHLRAAGAPVAGAKAVLRGRLQELYAQEAAAGGRRGEMLPKWMKRLVSSGEREAWFSS